MKHRKLIWFVVLLVVGALLAGLIFGEGMARRDNAETGRSPPERNQPSD